MKAMAHLKGDFHLSVIGKDSEWQKYQALAQRLHLDQRIHFFGPQKDIRPFYQLADALAIPSFYDPFANVTVEALAMGLFVISSKTNGGHEVLQPHNGAVIGDLTNLDSIREALSDALRHPKTKDSALEIRQSVKHLDFSCQLHQLIESCLGGGHGP
jgi:UDP-glucose:(heptosyl)LPS alpha-1,3-glucosyltransferase